MKPLQTQEQIDEMRKRLYDRGSAYEQIKRHQLSDTKIDVSRNWSNKPLGAESEASASDLPEAVVTPDDKDDEEKTPRKRRHYRSFILGGSLFIFIFVALLSTLFIYFGGNQISSDNVQISIQGPSSIGGGEVVSLQASVSNQNTVPIESATLILRYPQGTRSVDDSPRNLFEERIPINNIAVGEVQNIPIRVAFYGEENSQKKIEASVEYRVAGSNGMFYKDAKPLEFKISSSPLVLRISNIEKVASGQIVNLTMTAISNASTPIADIIITADYPSGFSFQKSEPTPIFGQNVWRIDELKPEQEVQIKLQGMVTGLTEETFRINFQAGPADSVNKNRVGANLANARADFIIERPFIDVKIRIGNNNSGDVILSAGQSSSVSIDITNTLDETVYDMVVEVVPGGNVLTETSIRGNNGFYDSNRGVVRWEVSNNSSFDRIFPGDSRNLSFSVDPGPNLTNAFYELLVNVYARRVAEASAVETLIGTTLVGAKYSANVTLGSQASHKSGSIPPKVGETSIYSVSLVAEAGANDTANAIVETSLPLYVEWLDTYEGDGTVTYNSVSKRLQWVIGDIPLGQRKQLNIDLSILPSVSQVGSTPVLLNTQNMRANDRFTSALLQDTSPPVTTELSTETGAEIGNGIVVR